MPVHVDPLSNLTGSGLTKAQAVAIAAATTASIEEAIGDLRREVRVWYVYLALYVLAQAGVGLLYSLALHAGRTA